MLVDLSGEYWQVISARNALASTATSQQADQWRSVLLSG